MGQVTEKKFKRIFDEAQQEALKNSPLYEKHLASDIKRGDVFPAFRNNRIDFYHKGGKLFTFDKLGYTTHIKYASVLQGHNKPYIDEKDLLNARLISNFMGEGYKRIKENCSLYSGVEAAGLSALFGKSSFILENNTANILILDIEVSLQSLEDSWEEEVEAKGKKRTQDRIDLLLYNIETRTLQFFEAKHFSNNELWAKKETKPRVVEQVKRYNQQLDKKHTEILKAYQDYVKIARSLFDIPFDQLPDPDKLETETILLVFGFDTDQKKKIERLLITDGSLNEISSRFFGNPTAASDLWNEKTVRKARVN